MWLVGGVGVSTMLSDEVFDQGRARLSLIAQYASPLLSKLRQGSGKLIPNQDLNVEVRSPAAGCAALAEAVGVLHPSKLPRLIYFGAAVLEEVLQHGLAA